MRDARFTSALEWCKSRRAGARERRCVPASFILEDEFAKFDRHATEGGINPWGKAVDGSVGLTAKAIGGPIHRRTDDLPVGRSTLYQRGQALDEHHGAHHT